MLLSNYINLPRADNAAHQPPTHPHRNLRPNECQWHFYWFHFHRMGFECHRFANCNKSPLRVCFNLFRLGTFVRVEMNCITTNTFEIYDAIVMRMDRWIWLILSMRFGSSVTFYWFWSSQLYMTFCGRC